MRFRNRKAAGLWAFAGCWLGMLGLFTWLYVRDGEPPGEMQGFMFPALVLFWVFGFALLANVSSKPCVFVSVDHNGIVATKLFPYRRERQIFPRHELRPAEVIDTRDDEGDPWYIARVSTRDGRHIDFKESNDREACVAACAKFNESLGTTHS